MVFNAIEEISVMLALIMLLRPWIRRSLFRGFEQAANLHGEKSKVNRKTWKSC